MSPRAYTPRQESDIAAKFADGARIADLRREFGGSIPAMKGTLKRQGVYEPRPPTAGRGGAHRRILRPSEMERVIGLWQGGMSVAAIGQSVHISATVIRRGLLAQGLDVKPRRRSPRGPEHGAWKGGRFIRAGYVIIRPERDEITASMLNQNGYMLEHRLVMARSLRRPLLRSESVHHVNGDRTDNRLENLQLRQGPHGNGVVMRCAECGSNNVEASRIR